MGDRIWAGIPSQYVTSQLGQLSLVRRMKEVALRNFVHATNDANHYTKPPTYANPIGFSLYYLHENAIRFLAGIVDVSFCSILYRPIVPIQSL